MTADGHLGARSWARAHATARAHAPYAVLAPRFRGDPARWLPTTSMHGGQTFRFHLWRQRLLCEAHLRPAWQRRGSIARGLVLDLSPSALGRWLPRMTGHLVLEREAATSARLSFEEALEPTRKVASAQRIASRLVVRLFLRTVANRLAWPAPPPRRGGRILGASASWEMTLVVR